MAKTSPSGAPRKNLEALAKKFFFFFLTTASQNFRGAPLGDVLAIFDCVSILNRYHLHFGGITCNYHLQFIICICSPSPRSCPELFGISRSCPEFGRSCSGFRGVVRNFAELSGVVLYHLQLIAGDNLSSAIDLVSLDL